MTGWFIVFEGGDGTGKSTQVRLLAQRLAAAGVDHLVTREPGGTWLGAHIRQLVLDPHSGDISAVAEALLYAADKAQHVHEVIRPALDRGAVVISDRYVDSTLAYQGAGRAVDPVGLEWVARWATEDLRPDLTVLLDIDPARAVAHKTEKDRLEATGLAFHQRARRLFCELADRDPHRYLVLEALTDRQRIADRVAARLAEIGVPGMTDGPSASGNVGGPVHD